MRRQLVIVSLLTALAQLAAFFKLWFTARVFGVGSELDGYNLALVIPTLVSGVMAGFVQTGFFPVRARLHASASRAQTETFERTVFWGSGLFSAVLSVIVVAGSEWFAALLAPNASPLVLDALRLALQFTGLLIAINLLGDCAGYLLAMRGHFAIAAGAPIVNGLLGGVLLAVWPEGGLLNLVLGTLLGLMAQVGICLYGLHCVGFSLRGPLSGWAAFKPQFSEFMRLGVWIFPGVLFSNLIVSLPPLWVADFGEGAVSAFGYAYRLHSSALQLLIMASSTVLLANFAEFVANKDSAAISRIIRKATLASMAIGIFSLFVVWIWGGEVLKLLFSGRFGSEAVARVSSHWIWLTAGLGFGILGNVLAKLWQAEGKAKRISGFGLVSLVTLVSSHFLLRKTLLEFSSAAALTVSPIVIVTFGFALMRLTSKKNPS